MNTCGIQLLTVGVDEIRKWLHHPHNPRQCFVKGRLPSRHMATRRTAMPFTGRWRIVEMEMLDREDIDLIEPGFIEFNENRTGEFGFIAVRGGMDCRVVEHDGRAVVEFSWEGHEEGDQVSGRGWAARRDDGSLEGRLYVHLGDDSGFRAEPFR